MEGEGKVSLPSTRVGTLRDLLDGPTSVALVVPYSLFLVMFLGHRKEKTQWVSNSRPSILPSVCFRFQGKVKVDGVLVQDRVSFRSFLWSGSDVRVFGSYIM